MPQKPPGGSQDVAGPTVPFLRTPGQDKHSEMSQGRCYPRARTGGHGEIKHSIEQSACNTGHFAHMQVHTGKGVGVQGTGTLSLQIMSSGLRQRNNTKAPEEGQGDAHPTSPGAQVPGPCLQVWPDRLLLPGPRLQPCCQSRVYVQLCPSSSSLASAYQQYSTLLNWAVFLILFPPRAGQ